MPVVLDVASGPAVLVFGVGGGLLVMVIAVLSEGLILKRLRGGSWSQALIAALLMNVVSGLLGIGFTYAIVVLLDAAGIGFAGFGSILIFLISFLLSIIIEALVLLGRRWPQPWRASLFANLVSYAMLAVIATLLFPGFWG